MKDKFKKIEEVSRLYGLGRITAEHAMDEIRDILSPYFLTKLSSVKFIDANTDSKVIK